MTTKTQNPLRTIALQNSAINLFSRLCSMLRDCFRDDNFNQNSRTSLDEDTRDHVRNLLSEMLHLQCVCVKFSGSFTKMTASDREFCAELFEKLATKLDNIERERRHKKVRQARMNAAITHWDSSRAFSAEETDTIARYVAYSLPPARLIQQPHRLQNTNCKPARKKKA